MWVALACFRNNTGRVCNCCLFIHCYVFFVQTLRHIRLGELLHEHSSDARLIVMWVSRDLSSPNTFCILCMCAGCLGCKQTGYEQPYRKKILIDTCSKTSLARHPSIGHWYSINKMSLEGCLAERWTIVLPIQFLSCDQNMSNRNPSNQSMCDNKGKLYTLLSIDSKEAVHQNKISRYGCVQISWSCSVIITSVVLA